MEKSVQGKNLSCEKRGGAGGGGETKHNIRFGGGVLVSVFFVGFCRRGLR